MAVELDDLVTAALDLKAKSGNQLGPVYAALSDEIVRLNDEIDLDALLPDMAGGLGMAAKKRDGETFANLFLGRIRSNLCSKDGEFNKLIGAGLNTSVSGVLSGLVVTLGLPVVALPILVPIAVLICHSGLEAFCQVAGHDYKS